MTHDQAIRDARAAYDKARTALFDAIHAALDDNEGPSKIARASGFTREYIAKIRDRKRPKEST